jgi:hypothetical protein
MKEQSGRALEKKSNVGTSDIVPMIAQPEYPVPPDVVEIRDQQTADWDLGQDIRILRTYLALETKKGGNPNTVAQLTRAIESLVRTNQGTALRTGEWLSRAAMRDLAFAMIAVIRDLVKPYISNPDEYSDFMLAFKTRLEQLTTRESAAAANEKAETT